jgi:predicted nuclease of predicted toxin-antitoxin system
VVAQALRDAGVQVKVHDDHFQQAATDVEWLTAAGRQNWVVLSKDKQIRRNPLERAAIANTRVKAFFLTHQGMSGPEMAEVFVRALSQMTSKAVSQPGPFIYTVSRMGVLARVK